MLMSPMRQTIVPAFATVTVYGGFAVGYAALSIARKYWLLPVWALLQAAVPTIMATLFHSGIIDKLPHRPGQSQFSIIFGGNTSGSVGTSVYLCAIAGSPPKYGFFHHLC
jgi:hypothetical protein